MLKLSMFITFIMISCLSIGYLCGYLSGKTKEEKKKILKSMFGL